MLRFLRLFLAITLSQVLLFFLFLIFAGAVLSSRQTAPQVRSRSVLWVRLGGGLEEYPTLPNIPVLQETPLSQSAILQDLEHAATDPRIEGVLLDLQPAALGWGKAAELRSALARYRKSGKPAWAYAPSLDEVGLYVASACDSIFLPPLGQLSLNGIGLGAMYFKGALDKLGLHANVYRIGPYKSAAEPFIRSNMSEPARQQEDAVLGDVWESFLDAVATSRKLPRASLNEALAIGVLEPEQAKSQGLIDAVRHRQDLLARFTEQDGKPRLVTAEVYRKVPNTTPISFKKSIAVVHTRGFILSGRNTYLPLLGTVLGETSVVRDLEEAAGDDGVAAIVLRIDSPGGEVGASDVIGHAVERAKRSKPVVVSMVDVAASGGYMMAYRASRIVALPTTITGSIGSFTGKLNARGLYDKIGVTEDFITRGPYPLFDSDYRDWSAAEESLVARHSWHDYRLWVNDIAAHRGMTPEAVDRVGEGRVWTGQQARDRHLVDELGDQERAVAIAKDLAGIPVSTAIRLQHYPREKGILELLQERDTLLSLVLSRTVHSLQLPQGLSWSVLPFELRP